MNHRAQYLYDGVCARYVCSTVHTATELIFGESGLFENEPTAPAEQAHTTRRQ